VRTGGSVDGAVRAGSLCWGRAFLRVLERRVSKGRIDVLLRLRTRALPGWKCPEPLRELHGRDAVISAGTREIGSRVPCRRSALLSLRLADQEHVGARSSEAHVVETAAVENVIAGPTLEPIVARLADQTVVAVVAE
jgi:hypothetical protein